ncbi:MAG TPA: hypothetical protein ENN55_05550 [Firmicutes bacterium]|nr:hypothetical protein [Bacillota bacterium]
MDGWKILGAPGISDGGAHSVSLFATAAGNIYSAFRETGNSNRTAVMRYFEDEWIYVGTRDFSSANVSDIAMYVYDETPYVAYKDPSFAYSVTCARNKTGNWEIPGYQISNGEASFIDIHFDENVQMPYIVFQDGATGKKAAVVRYSGAY